MTQHLPVVEAAADNHREALRHALSGEFDAAYEGFSHALGLLNWESEEDSAIIVQAARIVRDDGFTMVRKALRDGVPGEAQDQEFAAAKARLEQSANMTLPLAGGLQRPASGPPQNFLSKRQRREVIGEHGMTIGLLGELAVARLVAIGEITPDTKPTPEARAQEFQIAVGYDFAKIGTNQYYAARLARIGMRTERINGRPLNTLPWFGRLLTSVGRAALRDRGNFKQAVGQLVQVKREALSRADAFAATRNWRTV